jgi:hypothetical protein
MLGTFWAQSGHVLGKSGWGGYTISCVKFPLKTVLVFHIFCISWGGGHGRGARTTIIITTAKVYIYIYIYIYLCVCVNDYI